MLAKEHFDYFIFGHRHFPLDFTLNKTSRYINLGDWVRDFTYAYFDGSELFLKNGKTNTISFTPHIPGFCLVPANNRYRFFYSAHQKIEGSFVSFTADNLGNLFLITENNQLKNLTPILIQPVYSTM